MMEINKLKNNPAMIKLNLLINGVNIDKNFKICKNEALEKYIYDSSITTDLILPSEIILPNSIISNIFLENNSLFSLKERYLYYKNERLCNIKLTPEANFSNCILSDGTPASRIAVMYGIDVFAIFVNRHCSYFMHKGEGCYFCSIDYTKKNKGKQNIPELKLKNVIETLNIALEKDKGLFNYILISSGAYNNPNKGIEHQLNYIKSMKKISGRSVRYHLVTIPPTSDELLYSLAEEGPDSIAFDIEVFDPNIFKKYCPGKEKQIGYERFLNIFEKSSKIFKKNAVKAGFVCGLESIETLSEGMNFFGKLGIHPSLNIFHPDEGTPLFNYSRPSIEYMLEGLSEQNKITKSYGLIPIFPEFGRRSSLDTEVYKGFFNETN